MGVVRVGQVVQPLQAAESKGEAKWATVYILNRKILNLQVQQILNCEANKSKFNK